MLQQRLQSELARVAERHRTLRFWQSLAVAWLVGAVVSLLLWLFRNNSAAIWRPLRPWGAWRGCSR